VRFELAIDTEDQLCNLSETLDAALDKVSNAISTLTKIYP
jgi:hypothetical protein